LASLLLYTLFSTCAFVLSSQLMSQSQASAEPVDSVRQFESGNILELADSHPVVAARDYGSTSLRGVSNLNSGVRASGREQLAAAKRLSYLTLAEFFIRLAALAALALTWLIFTLLLPPRLFFGQPSTQVTSAPAAAHLRTLPPWTGHYSISVPSAAPISPGFQIPLIEEPYVLLVPIETLQCLPFGSTRSLWPAELAAVVLLLCGLLVCMCAELGERLHGYWLGISQSTGAGASPYMLAASHGLPSTLLGLLRLAQLGRGPLTTETNNSEVVDGVDVWEEIMSSKKSSL
jgi:hypothetical protein